MVAIAVNHLPEDPRRVIYHGEEPEKNKGWTDAERNL
jgi:hypothetical protein